ncbi:MAG: tetraacyldisaccharide 4'-kinase, partial [Desulfobulbia bacterium]
MKSQRLPVPVISIGNLTLGGTGKTPMVRYVTRLLLDRGVRPAIVSRGYGGKAAGRINIVADRTKTLLPPEMAGDEPFMLAEVLPGVPVLTGSQRARVARHAVEAFGANLIVMDDGFQHLALRRDLDLVLFSARTLLGNGRVFPGGELREPLSALGRAHAFVITGVDASNRSVV